MHFSVTTATCKVIGKVLREPVCRLSSLLYEYRIAVLFHKLYSRCVSHVKKQNKKKEQYGSVFIAVLYCQYILQLNRLFTHKRLKLLCQTICVFINRKSYILKANHFVDATL